MRSAVLTCKILVAVLLIQPALLLFAKPQKTHALTGGGVTAIVNEMRAQNGLAPLRYSGALSSSAYAKANDMIAKNYWSHYSPDVLGPAYFIGNAGYGYITAGENLAKGFAYESSIVNAWMGSASHRANLLNPNFQDMGVAVVPGVLQGVQTTIVVGHFGQSSYAPAPAPVPAPAPAPAPVSQPAPAPVAPAPVATQQHAISTEPVQDQLVQTQSTPAEDAPVLVPSAPSEQQMETAKDAPKRKNSLLYDQFLTSIPKFDLKRMLQPASK